MARIYGMRVNRMFVILVGGGDLRPSIFTKIEKKKKNSALFSQEERNCEIIYDFTIVSFSNRKYILREQKCNKLECLSIATLEYCC